MIMLICKLNGLKVAKMTAHEIVTIIRQASQACLAVLPTLEQKNSRQNQLTAIFWYK